VGVIGIEFGSEQRSAFGIEAERWAVLAEILGPGLKVVAGVSEFEDAGSDEVEGGGTVGVWEENRKLSHVVKAEVHAANLLSGDKVKRQ
jgi:hypothetical protein